MNILMIRFFDLIISTLIIIILFPLLILISILIFSTDGMPIIFKQYRVGYRGKNFIFILNDEKLCF